MGMEVQRNDTLVRSELIVRCLTTLALPSCFNRPNLSEKDYEAWEGFLEPYSEDEIIYAFDAWARNGSRWPVFADIIGIADAYRRTNAMLEAKDLPSGREKLRGNWLALWLVFKKVSDRLEEFRKAKREYVPLKDEEIDVMLEQSQVEAQKLESRRPYGARASHPKTEGVR